MSRPTKSKPLDDRKMWKQLLAKTHPDAGGSHEAFLFAQALQEHVLAGGGSVGVQNGQARPQPEPPRPPRAEHREDHKESVLFDASVPFDALTSRALKLADGFVEPLYGDLLRLLEDCVPVYDGGSLEKQQRRGATYKQLAAIGHAVGMSMAQRVRWYEIAEDVPLSRRHAGHLIKKIKEEQTA